MKKTRTIRALGASILSAAFLLAVAPSGSAALNYNVTINTAALVGNLDAPFALDLELNTGSGNVTNSVTLSNFTFTGGGYGPSGSIYSTGGVSGSFASTLTLTNSSANNIFAENFAPSVTSIHFSVSQTTNSEVVGSGTPIMDQFNAFIDDANTSDGFISTNAPGGADSLVSSTITSGETTNGVEFYSGTGEFAGVVAVPEPGTAIFGIALGALSVFRRRRNA
jgi:hypothetical protein